MGFIRRNLRDCTKPVKAAAYTTMARPTLEYAFCLDISKLMYDLEHDDETVVISSLLKWLPVKVLYNMRHAARCALRVVVVDKPNGSPLRILVTRAVSIVLALYIFQGTFNCIAKETRLFPRACEVFNHRTQTFIY
jgi:hypothetical protein